jgi:hypothetical protein
MQNIPGKVPFEEFYWKAIETLSKDNKIDPSTGRPYVGIHIVYSGFNQIFKQYYGMDPRPITDKLASEGKIGLYKVKGGAIITLPKDIKSYEKKIKFNPDEHFAKFDASKFDTNVEIPTRQRTALDDIIEDAKEGRDDVPFYNLTPRQQEIYKRIGNKGDPDNERSFNPANRHKKCAKPSPKRIKKSSKPSKVHSKKICSCKKKK